MIPPFNEHGELPPGVHEATFAEFEDRLGFSNRRRELLGRLCGVVLALEQAGVLRVYVGGSFVTTKEAPGDIDACWDLDPLVDVSALGPEFQEGGTLAGTADLPDLHLMPDDPELRLVRSVLAWSREGRPKGIVALSLEPQRLGRSGVSRSPREV